MKTPNRNLNINYPSDKFYIYTLSLLDKIQNFQIALLNQF